MTLLLPQRGPNESAESWIDRALPILSQNDAAAGGTAVSGGRVYVSAGGGSARGLLDLGVLAGGNIIQVDTTNIEDAAVATAKLADLGITTEKIASGAVTEDELGALSVTNAKLAELAVDAAKLANSAVTSTKIANAAVGTAAIANAAITTALIADANVTTAKIANLAVDSAQINDAAIVTAKIGDLAVTSAKINDLSANKITAGTIGVNQVYVGGTEFELQGLNKIIVIKDEQGSPVTRIRMGKLSGTSTDYGMQVFDSSGNTIIDAGTNNILYGQNITCQALEVQDDGGSNRAIKINGNGLDAQIEFGGTQVIKGGANNDLAIEGTSLDQVFVAGSELSVTSTNGLTVSNKAAINSSAAAVSVTQSYATNGSFTGNVLALLADRAAASSYGFLTAVSSNSGSSDTEFILRGDGNAFADGSWSGGGADYAEYFESKSGDAIPPGTPVVLDGAKIKPALTASDAIIGVVRPVGVSAVVGNGAWNNWRGKYVRDQWGKKTTETVEMVQWTETIITKPRGRDVEDDSTKEVQCSYFVDDIPKGVTVPDDAERFSVERPVFSEGFDPDQKYTPREERDEWNVVGLVGQVEILKGKPVNPRWIKMGGHTDSLDLWYIR